MTDPRTRESGLILHPTSLPGRGGVGTLGEEAYRWIDFLARAEQQIWQLLPLGPTGLGNSPYMCTSAFAGNPLLVDLAALHAAGWLEGDPLGDAPASTGAVDFGAVIAHKQRWLKAAHQGFQATGSPEDKDAFEVFKREQASWLLDFAIFTAVGESLDHRPWTEWPAPVRDRDAEGLAEVRAAHPNIIDRICFEQWIFDRQWQSLRAYANQRRVKIVGDIPIFVAHNSADVWANRDIFFLDHEGLQTVVAGVPPDYFSETGQLWGNPLYNWEVLANRDYDWWMDRFRATFRLVDRVRIDHFRGFDAYWEVEAGAQTAIDGKWVPGPGKAFFDRVRNVFGDIPVIAEDLGIITDSVEALRDDVGLPGMKVLHFAWDGGADHGYLPHNYPPHCVVYTGTHDNDTTVGWYHKLPGHLADKVRRYFNVDGNDIAWQLLQGAWASVADLAICPVQDILSLGSDQRMNTPGVAEGNWAWRLEGGQLQDAVADRLRLVTRKYGRSAVSKEY